MLLTLGFTPCFSAGGPWGGGWTRICLNRVPSGPVYTSGLEERCPLPSSLPSPDHPRAPLPKAPHCTPPPTEVDVQGEWPAWGTYAKNHSNLNSYSGGGFEIDPGQRRGPACPASLDNMLEHHPGLLTRAHAHPSSPCQGTPGPGR